MIARTGGRRRPSTRGMVPRACIAVDWAGSLSSVRSSLWLAESHEQRLVRLECGFTRDELVLELIACARRNPSLVVGLDFAFSFPRWFLDALGVTRAREAWDRVALDGESWLADCPPPFWGRPSHPRPELFKKLSPWRATEIEHQPIGSIRPKSVFQIAGAGAVGTGSLRGVPYLAELQDAGFAIWPFDRARLPMVVEIYPRALTGRVNKSQRAARALYLQTHHASEPLELLQLAESSQDAFDAAVSAARMQRFAFDFKRLASMRRTELDRSEGRIWIPSCSSTSREKLS